MSDRASQPTVVSCLIERAAKLLICTQGGQDDIWRVWEFPTGLVEQGDRSPESATRRLTLALVGLHIDIHTGQPPFVAEYQGETSAVRFYLATVTAGEAKPIGYREVRWVEGTRLSEYDFTPLHRPVVAWYAKS